MIAVGSEVMRSSSLRAQRSNPAAHAPGLDCRVASLLAMTASPSALARLEAAVGLVDDVGAAPAADHAAVAVARLEGLQRIADLHGLERLPVSVDAGAESEAPT